ncbi:hypothetical protein DMC47_22540 [Nostoc sp. 3335mG]|nr:hypothetical protein DMC47_22540 [Nostoc sp. 3335mG]
MPAGPVRALLGTFVLSGIVWAGTATGCTPGPNSWIPSAIDLAVKADAIILARVDGERGAGEERDVLASTEIILDGRQAPRRVVIAESGLSNDPKLVFRSPPRELREPNTGALLGGCRRYIFSRGMRLVLFLARTPDGRWQALQETFARDAEDVADRDALWVKAVREYAAIARLPAPDRPAAMRRRMQQLRAAGNRDAVAIADDMRIELSRKR